MQKKISLQKIIESVLDDKGVEYDKTNDANVQSLRRAFYKLLERLGSDKEVLKCGKRNIEFKEAEVPFMKVVFSQLYEKNGIIDEFINEKNEHKKFSSRDVHKLIQDLLDEADKAGMDEEELIELAQFFSRIFLASPLRSIEYCHSLIDKLALTLQDLTYSEQAGYLIKVENILKKEFGLRFAEFTLNTEGLAYLIDERRKYCGDNINSDKFYEYDPEIRYSYIQRDRAVLERIQEDDELRQYIEKKLGKKAEEIFDYAELDDKTK